MILPSCQVHDAGELTGAPSASVLVMPHMLVNPQHPNPCETGGVIRCGLQTRLDMGPHGIPRGCQLSSQSCNGGSLEAQLSDRPADRPHTQTRPGCAHPLVMFQECHRLAGVFAAYPAPYCATGHAPGPRPRARQSPPPPRARGLERFSPQPGQPAQRSQDSMSSTGPHSRQAAATRWKPSKPTSRPHRSQRSQRSSDTARQQVGRDTARGPLKAAGVEVRSSPGTSTSTRNPRPTPGHPHSTRKSRFLELHTPFPADQRQTQPNCHTKSNSRLDTFSEFEISRRVYVAPALPGIHYLNL